MPVASLFGDLSTFWVQFKVAQFSSDLIFPCSTLAPQMTMLLIKYDILA